VRAVYGGNEPFRGNEPFLFTERIHPYNVRMDPAPELGKWLLLSGAVLAVVGALLLVGSRLPLRLGRLPGDLAIEGRRGSFYFSVVTCLLLSVIMTLVFWLIGWLRR
jgi:hypothetical protein